MLRDPAGRTARTAGERSQMDSVYLDEIYLNKGDEANASYNWVYYRLTSVDELGHPSGKEGSTIQICRVTWPSFGDEGTPVDTPGHAGVYCCFSLHE